MSKYLLTINIGPVQGFIAAARRTRDLHAGSRLLSRAAFAAAQTLQGHGAKLIFPKASDNSKLEGIQQDGIPNVILAEIEADSLDVIKSLAKEAEEAARRELANIAREVFGKNETAQVLQQKNEAIKQVHDLLEFFWAAVPVEGSYPEARERLGRLMAARKNTRDFGPNPWPAPVPKSSLDGALESVIYQADEQQRLKVGIRIGEQLSGVDLLKRRYLEEKNESFASTTVMALIPFLEGLSSQEAAVIEEALDQVAQKLGAGRSGRRPPKSLVDKFELLKKYDPRLFFPGRHQEIAQEPKEQPTESAARTTSEQEVIREAQGTLSKTYSELDKTPCPYYAILHADGDRMGKAIDAQKNAEQHRKLSAALTEFSQKVKEIVQSHSGSLVYSGGDDVLALLPLHTALDCARELAEDFESRLSGFKGSDDNNPTLSVGLAVVHHLFDLGEALNLARRAEKEAKKTRNALAVIFSPRSGSETIAAGKWCEKPNMSARLKNLAAWQDEGKIPRGFAYELREMASTLSGFSESKKLISLEAVRILKRKVTPDTKVESALADWIERFGAERLSSELIVAWPFAKAFQLASRPKEVAK